MFESKRIFPVILIITTGVSGVVTPAVFARTLPRTFPQNIELSETLSEEIPEASEIAHPRLADLAEKLLDMRQDAIDQVLPSSIERSILDEDERARREMYLLAHDEGIRALIAILERLDTSVARGDRESGMRYIELFSRGVKMLFSAREVYRSVRTSDHIRAHLIDHVVAEDDIEFARMLDTTLMREGVYHEFLERLSQKAPGFDMTPLSTVDADTPRSPLTQSELLVSVDELLSLGANADFFPLHSYAEANNLYPKSVDATGLSSVDGETAVGVTWRALVSREFDDARYTADIGAAYLLYLYFLSLSDLRLAAAEDMRDTDTSVEIEWDDEGQAVADTDDETDDQDDDTVDISGQESDEPNFQIVDERTYETLGTLQIQVSGEPFFVRGISFANIATLSGSTVLDRTTGFVPAIAATGDVWAYKQLGSPGDYVIDQSSIPIEDAVIEIRAADASDYEPLAFLEYQSGLLYRIAASDRSDDGEPFSNGAIANTDVTLEPGINSIRLRAKVRRPTSDNDLSGQTLNFLLHRLVLEWAASRVRRDVSFRLDEASAGMISLSDSLFTQKVLRADIPFMSVPNPVSGTLIPGDQDIFRFRIDSLSGGGTTIRRIVFRIRGELDDSALVNASYDSSGVPARASFSWANGGILDSFRLIANGVDLTASANLRLYALHSDSQNYLVADISSGYTISDETVFTLRARTERIRDNDFLVVDIPRLAGTALITASPEDIDPLPTSVDDIPQASVIWSDRMSSAHGPDSDDYTNEQHLGDGATVLPTQSLTR